MSAPTSISAKNGRRSTGACATCDPQCTQLTIKPLRSEYTNVLKKNGQPFSSQYPILGFRIECAKPNVYYDIQLTLDSDKISDSPGINNGWNKNNAIKDRVRNMSFSSWTQGHRGKTDASGKATFTLPLEWWQDMARQSLSSSGSIFIYYKVFTFETGQRNIETNTSTYDYLTVKQNILTFKVESRRYYIDVDKARKETNITIYLNVPNSIDMYAFVQWIKGKSRDYQYANIFAPDLPDHYAVYGFVKKYGLNAISLYSEYTIDSTDKKSRYTEFKATWEKTSSTIYSTNDHPSTKLDFGSSGVYSFARQDFLCNLYLSMDVPEEVTIKEQTEVGKINGKSYYKVRATFEPDAVVIASKPWKLRILIERILKPKSQRGSNPDSATAKFKVTHPEDFNPSEAELRRRYQLLKDLIRRNVY